MSNYKKHFPITNQYTYLNTPASGLLPEPVMEWRHNHDLDFFIQGSMLKMKQGEVLTEVREKVGRLFNCAPNRVALTPNFSYGFNTLLEGIPNSQKVLLLKQDYPSLIWPFTSREFDVNFIDITANLEEAIEEAFAKAQPNIFALSLVQWINGIKMDQEFLKRLKANYPETLFFADGTQYLGTEVFDFENSALDVVGASTYKWLNAGYGNGLFLFKERVASYAAPKTTGFNSLQGKYKPQEGSFIGRFEPGHQDTLNYGSLGAAIDLINDIGMETIDRTVKELSSAAQKAFEERGLLEENVVGRPIHSNIFNLKGNHMVYKRLRENDILCIERGDGIRVGFHYYNTKEDLNALLKVLDSPK